MTPAEAKLGYTLSIIFLILALFALPYTLSNPASFTMDVIVIAMLMVFLLYIIISIRREVSH